MVVANTSILHYSLSRSIEFIYESNFCCISASNPRGRGGRHFSAPPKNGGGLGRPQPRQAPPDSKYEEPVARGENKENRIPSNNRYILVL